MKYVCKYCGKECKNDNSLRNHERLCKCNPTHQTITNWSRGFADYNIKLSKGEVVRRASNQYIKAEELGIDKPSLSEESRNKLSASAAKRTYSEDLKKRISESMKNAVKNHPESYSSRLINSRKHRGEYKGFRMDSKWEEDVARYLDEVGVSWIKSDRFFEYMWNGSLHRYFPDFYLPEYDRYIEVKGYERERDTIKYKSVPNLILIKQKEITEIHNKKYNIFDILALSSAGS